VRREGRGGKGEEEVAMRTCTWEVRVGGGVDTDTTAAEACTAQEVMQVQRRR